VNEAIQFFRDSADRITEIKISVHDGEVYYSEKLDDCRIKVYYDKDGTIVKIKVLTSLSDKDFDIVDHHDPEYPFELEVGGEG